MFPFFLATFFCTLARLFGIVDGFVLSKVGIVSTNFFESGISRWGCSAKSFSDQCATEDAFSAVKKCQLATPQFELLLFCSFPYSIPWSKTIHLPV